MIAVPSFGSSVAATALSDFRTRVDQRIEVDDAMPLGQQAGFLQQLALEPGHVRQVGLDVGEAIAVALHEGQPARRQSGGDLDHLAHAAVLDRAGELAVDALVPRQHHRGEGNAAEQLGRADHGAEAAVEALALRRRQRRVRHAVAGTRSSRWRTRSG